MNLQQNKRHLNWIMILLIINSLFLFQGCNIPKRPKKITLQEFENEIIQRDDLESINIVNEKRVEVFIKKEQLYKTKSENNSREYPQYYFVINSEIESFTREVYQIQQDSSKKETFNITHERRKNVIKSIVPYILPSILILFQLFYIILWIYSLIKIIRTVYKNPFYNVSWIIIITFIPIVGLIIYLTIGKRKTPNNIL
jgi:ATP-dependent Zn protease